MRPRSPIPHEALGLLHEAVANAGHDGRFRYGLDCAATHYYDADSGTYEVAGAKRDRDGMIELYQELIREFDVVTIEDPLDESDFEGFAELTEASGIQIVGDDLFVTNPERLRIGLEAGAANSLLWKVNQIGTLSEALDAADMAHRAGYTVVVSERSGETEDPIIADLAVALGAGPDQDRRPRPRRADGEVQPPDPHRGGARSHSLLPGRRVPGGDRRVISNSAELAATGMADVRALALRVAAAGLEACDVRIATTEAVELTDGGIAFAGREYPLEPGARVVVVGSGKATLAIASTLEGILGDRLDGGAIAVRNGADAIALSRVEVMLADHPLPTERSEAAARRVMELVDELGPGDLAIAAFTGGSSALTSLPPNGVTQAEKRRLHELLLGSGAPIVEVNAVRKHVSAIKGGRLAERVAPARLVSLTVSDVAGDVLDAITDPSVQDTSTVDDALEILHRRGLWGELPPSIRDHLASDAAHSPRLTTEPQTVMLVNGAGVCDAMAAEAQCRGRQRSRRLDGAGRRGQLRRPASGRARRELCP